MARPWVLVVTDDPETAEAIRATLTAEGYDVDTAGRATDAFAPGLVADRVEDLGLLPQRVRRRPRPEPAGLFVGRIPGHAHMLAGLRRRGFAVGCEHLVPLGESDQARRPPRRAAR